MDKKRARYAASLGLVAAMVAAAELLGGGEIPLPGLGKLKSKDVAARKGRNPRTGETLDIPAHKAVTFTACKDLKEAMKP